MQTKYGAELENIVYSVATSFHTPELAKKLFDRLDAEPHKPTRVKKPQPMIMKKPLSCRKQDTTTVMKRRKQVRKVKGAMVLKLKPVKVLKPKPVKVLKPRHRSF